MKVLFISRKWPPSVGGMETYSAELSSALGKRDDIELEILSLAGRQDGSAPGLIAVAFFLTRCAFRLAVSGGKYDVIHYGDMVQVGLARWARLFSRSPVQVVALHGLDVIYGRRPGFLPSVYRRYTRFSAANGCVDCYIANSRNTAKLLTESGIGPVEVIPLAVRLDSEAPAEQVEPFTEPPFVLFFGRIFRRKGVRWFAESVLPLLPDDVRLYVAGSVWDEDDARYLAGHSRVRMLGAFPIDFSLEEFEKLKRTALAIVMPNVKNENGLDVEGFGLTALEASNNGAPLIAADLEGIRDAVVHERTGFLEQPENAEAWATRIRELRSWDGERRRQFAEASRRILLERYSWERVADDCHELYRKLARRH